ncbi:MAG TPA: adenylate/guanylate cyclase domain-containing protein [Actinomycetota bacterium]|nr:adenylate/guanylate cyclase domain-containing protein [Actinomycetota bacterium]
MSGTGEGSWATGGVPATRAFVVRVASQAIGANVLGAIVVYLFLSLISPSASTTEESIALELATFGAYVIGGTFAALRIGHRTFEPVARWLDEERPPTEEELEQTLDQPRRQAAWVLLFWIGGAALFAAIHIIPGNPVHHDPRYGVLIGAIGILGGLAATMLTYLLVDQSLRPVFALALARTTPLRPHTLGVKQRILASWALGSAVVFVAIALTPLGSPRLELALWFLAPVGLIGGGLIIWVAAKSVAAPVVALRGALARIEDGDFGARVEVDDGSEVGLLQAGFNRMAAGLAERERLREVFGTYVDREIAEHILREGTSLEGEEVEVTIMFLDIRDFTGFAERSPARDVVAAINRLFERVVPVVHDHKGHVDKFVGDGVLAVFGAPRRQPDHADLALAAALEIQRAVREDLGGELSVGIGLNSGTVVAGNVGGGGRFEFSVIGDAVNVAARIEAATRTTGDTILLSERTKELLKDAPPLAERTDVALKGKRERVCLYAVGGPSVDGDRTF